MNETVIFAIGAVMFTITTSATFLFLMLRFNEVYEAEDAELETLEEVGVATETDQTQESDGEVVDRDDAADPVEEEGSLSFDEEVAALLDEEMAKDRFTSGLAAEFAVRELMRAG